MDLQMRHNSRHLTQPRFFERHGLGSIVGDMNLKSIEGILYALGGIVDPVENDVSKNRRRLFILEDLEPKFVDRLGEHLDVDPLIFSSQMNTWYVMSTELLQATSSDAIIGILQIRSQYLTERYRLYTLQLPHLRYDTTNCGLWTMKTMF